MSKTPRKLLPPPAPASKPLAAVPAVHFSVYDKKVHPQVARALARAGTPKEEAAVILGIDGPTFDAWCAANPEFTQALREGRQFADARVEDSLYRRATGYEYDETVIEDGPKGRTVTITKKHVVAEPQAAMIWLRGHTKSPLKR